MSDLILAIDKNAEAFLRESAAWEKQNISVLRVESMDDAISRLLRESFLFVAINADNTDYCSMLPVMREATNAPIFIITSDFSITAQTEALHNGADVYAPFQQNAEENVLSALALLYRHDEQVKRASIERTSERGILSIGKILIMEHHFRVFVSGQEVHLTPTEFRILVLLMKNRKQFFTYGRLLREVWGYEYEDNSRNLVWCQVRDLKKKLRTGTDMPEYIYNIRGLGYRFEA